MLNDPVLMGEEELVSPTQRSMDNGRAQVDNNFAAPTRGDFTVEALQAFRSDERGLVPVGCVVMQQGNADLGADVVQLERLEQPVTQDIRKEASLANDLVKAGTPNAQAIGKVGERNALPGEFSVDQALVLVVFAELVGVC
ncbi:hypothetical protein [Agrobacterium sp.]|uniref:hypothetical protein n=1 Tax=Agrobacterium sp. TaxID=361 RepID=UPI004033A656